MLPITTSAKIGALEEFEALGEKFDHLTTGYEITGAHVYVLCEKCHIGGVFEALPRQCDGCHDGVIATGKPSAHVETTQPCDVC
ncbi:MAG: hypothetical protein R3240_08425, partial [Gammaproteobacteria bacterium]|nr:hypothetical protein [Gammaproteobacteria bacterium]